MTNPQSRHFVVIAQFLAVGILLAFSGCNTLSSMGLPFGNSGNKIIDPALQISRSHGAAVSIPKELQIQPLDVYVVEIGDTLLLEAVKFDATIRMPGDQLVKPDGYISLGESGRLMVANKTLEQIQVDAQVMIDAHLRRDLEIELMMERSERESEERSSNSDVDGDREERLALERRYNRSVLQNEISARLISWESKKIYVMGEVNSPGSFTFNGSQTVLDAIIEAGGMTSKADHHQVIVSRPSSCGDCRTVIQVCYDQIVQLGDASTNYQLGPGDRVFVPSLTFVEDLRRSLCGSGSDRCPMCGPCPTGCQLPTGCYGESSPTVVSDFNEVEHLIE